MFDEAISLLSIWASMNSWLTPTFLFLFLNLMIGTIFITSSFNNSPKPQPQPQPQQPPSQITRAPSVLQRLKSINIYSYYSQTHLPESDPFQPEKNPSRSEATVPTVKFIHEPEPRPEAAETVKNRTRSKTWAPAIQEDFTDEEGPTLDEIYSRIKGISNGHNRQNSDTLPMSGDIPVRLPAKMKKSASDESAFNHFETTNAVAEVEESELTAAVIAAASGVGGAEVDARADDFINRFKKQLELQRIESIVRYKDMITRGSAM